MCPSIFLRVVWSVLSRRALCNSACCNMTKGLKFLSWPAQEMQRRGLVAELMLRVVAECVTITVCNAFWEEWLEAPKT